jgi:parvulin-like peptidyl-prolyl isomerase
MRAKGQLPAEYERVRVTLVKRDLPGVVQRHLLFDHWRSTASADQIKELTQKVDKLFEGEIEKLKRELEVSTRAELDKELETKGTSLQRVKETFTCERLAMESLHFMMPPQQIDPAKIAEYYQSHLEEFARKETVTWQQIQVSFANENSKGAANKKIRDALRELEANAEFADVVKKYSDGPNDGYWKGMVAETLVDSRLEKMLFEMPIGQWSPIYEGESQFHLVRVQDRKPAYQISLADAQKTIYPHLATEQFNERAKQLFVKLYAEAVIETKYDLQRPK